MSQKSEMRPSIEANSLAEKAALEEIKGERGNETLKKVWLLLANQLEIEGIPKEKISSVGKSLIVTQKKEKLKKLGYPEDELKSITISGWWREVMNSIGCTDSKYSTTEVTVPSPDNGSIYTQNGGMIELCCDLIDVLRVIIDKSKDDKINLEETFGKNVMDEFYAQQKTITSNIQNAIDHKTKIPDNTEIFLLEIMATSGLSVNKCGEKFMEENLIRLKEQGTLSKRTGKPVPFLDNKQAKKFTKGESISKQILLQPKNREQALYLEYTTDKACSCDSWRIRNRICFDCGKKHTETHVSKCNYCQIPLFRERLLYIVKTGKCENCTETVDLPQDMIKYANS